MAPTLISLAGVFFSFLFFELAWGTVVYWSLSEDECDVARRKGPSPINENFSRDDKNNQRRDRGMVIDKNN
jgi:hypothetical protein